MPKVSQDGDWQTGLTGSLQSEIQFLDAQAIAGSATFELSPSVDVSEYQRLGLGIFSDTSHAMTINIAWRSSSDSTVDVVEVFSGTATRKSIDPVLVRSAKMRIQVINDDASSHTFSGWYYLIREVRG